MQARSEPRAGAVVSCTQWTQRICRHCGFFLPRRRSRLRRLIYWIHGNWPRLRLRHSLRLLRRRIRLLISPHSKLPQGLVPRHLYIGWGTANFRPCAGSRQTASYKRGPDGYLDRGTGLRFSFGTAQLVNIGVTIGIVGPPSRGRLIGNGLEGQEIVLEANGIGIEKMLDAFVAVRLQDETGVMIFVHAIGDFRIAVGIWVGMFLAREAQDDSGVISARCREGVRLLPCSDFEARPFAPEIDAAGGFDDVGDVSAADTRGDFEKIKLAVGVGFQEF